MTTVSECEFIIMSTRTMILSGILLILLPRPALGYGEQANTGTNNNNKQTSVLDLIGIIPQSKQYPCDGLLNHKDCENVADGAYQDQHTKNCSEFYRCEKGKRINCTCGSQSSFSPSTKQCTHETRAPPCSEESLAAQQTCSKEENGGFYVVNGTQCRAYYQCQDYRQIHRQCPPNEIFDTESLSCMPDDEAVCVDVRVTTTPPTTTTTASVAECTHKGNGKHAYAYDKRRFFVCSGGIKTSEGACLEGQLFIERLQRCVSLLSSDESSRPISSTDHRCIGLTDGYYPDAESGCTTFYCCKNECVLFESVCPEESKFDVQTRQCQDAKQVVCLSEADGDCTDKPDGYHIVYSTYCKQFVFCNGGKKLSEVSCPVSKTSGSDGDSCKDHETEKCQMVNYHTLNESSECAGKTSGEYYPDLATNCKSFFFCKDGRKMAVFACHQEGHIFDYSKKRCLPAVDGMTCQMQMDVDNRCTNATDGYFASISKQCSSFYQCKNGRMVSESECPKGNIFDERSQKCRPQDQVRCLVRHLSDGTAESQQSGSFCTNKVDGFYPNFLVGCHRYYHCRQFHKTAEYVCTAGQLFDPVSLQCLPESRVTCSQTPAATVDKVADGCYFRSDGYYANYVDNCHTYYYCQGWSKTMDLTCPPQKAFDNELERCIDARTAICIKDKTPELRDDECSGRTNGYYVNNVSSCQTYFVCYNEKLVTFKRCSANSVFNLRQLRCTDTKVTQCSFHNRSICNKERGDNYAGDGTQIFHQCAGKQHVLSGSCFPNEVFDSATKSCVPTATSKTIASIDFDCQDRFDGLYTEVDKGCSHYHVCVNGKLIKTAQCPTDHLFDPRKQSCKPSKEVSCDIGEEPSSASKSSNATTTLQQIGLHLHFGSACRNVTICFESVDVLSSQCSSVHESKTDDRRSRTCKIGGLSEMRHKESHDVLSSYNCNGKEDGYYTDPKSQCRKWHMCEGGLGTTHECDNGMAFNILHKRCDQKDNVVCAAQSWVYRNYSSGRSASPHQPQYEDIVTALDRCRRKSDGIYIDLDNDYGDSTSSLACHRVYLCIKEHIYDISCPFSSEGADKPSCSSPDCVPINASTVPPSSGRMATNATHSQTWTVPGQPETLHRQLQKQTSPFDCRNKTNGLYVDLLSSCKSFHVCLDGRLASSNNCTKPLAFDLDMATCDATAIARCPIVNNISRYTYVYCKPNLTKFHPDVGSNCQKYFGCDNGQFQYNSCPEGTTFNAVTSSCSDSTSSTLPPCSANGTFDYWNGALLAQPSISEVSVASLETSPFDCTDKPDGFYADYGQKCHVFYRCVRSKKFSHYCKLGQLFNPLLKSCDFTENVRCQEDLRDDVPPP